MEEADFCAINVTIPYKETVMPYLHHIHKDALAIGAVNTVVNRGGRLYGYNTDFYGLSALLRHAGISLSGCKVLILGTGGTAKTARAVASAEGAREILTVSRRAEEGFLTYGEVYRDHTDADVIINTTPCGMYPYPDGRDGMAGTPIDAARFPALTGVIDAIYNPLRTNLVLDCRSRGIPAEGGLYMLVAQAVLASRIFLGEEPEAAAADPTLTAVTDRVFGEVRAKKENIVLTGMPASGKTTVGRLLAERLGRTFIDTDAEIVRVAERPITRIFREEGEAAFRAWECDVIARIANEARGCVIATGGGAILDEGNLRALSRSGRIYFIDRPLADLLPTPDRPLALTREAIEARYRERYGRYLATADCTVPNAATPEAAAETIRKDFLRDFPTHISLRT
jgi:shikimate dehydrogenase